MERSLFWVGVFLLAVTGLFGNNSGDTTWLTAPILDKDTVFLAHWDNAGDMKYKVETGQELLNKHMSGVDYKETDWGAGLIFSSTGYYPLVYSSGNNKELRSGTVEFWFRPTGEKWVKSTHVFFTIYSHLTPQDWWKNRIQFLYQIEALRLVVGDKEGKIVSFDIPQVFLTPEEWYHLGFSWKFGNGEGKDEVKIFCNGEQIGYWTGLTLNMDLKEAKFIIGGEEPDKIGWLVDGIMDELRVSRCWRDYTMRDGAKSFFETNKYSIYLSKNWFWEKELEKARVKLIPDSTGKILYVDWKSEAGGDGTEEHPFNSIRMAAEKASSGDRIVIAGGVYREVIPLKTGIQIFAKKGEEVIIKGSKIVKGWQYDRKGNYYFADGVGLEFSFSGVEVPLASNVRNKNPNTPDIVFCDEKMLERCETLEEMGDRINVFYWDRSAKRIYVRLADSRTPDEHMIEVGTKWTPFEGGGDDVVLKGLTFTHFANPPYGEGHLSLGGITVSGNNWLVEDCTSIFNAGVGIMLRGNNNIIRKCKSIHNGWLGFFAFWGTYGNKIIECESSYNNWKYINPVLGSGGMKFCLVSEYIISGCKVLENQGPGIWFDDRSRDVVIINNVIMNNNAHAGIMYEISYAGIIKDNFCAFNDTSYFPSGEDIWLGGGILIQNSAGCIVENNILFKNAHGIIFVDGDRCVSTNSPNNRIEENYYLVYNNTIRKNILIDNKGYAIVQWHSSNVLPFKDSNNISVENCFIEREQSPVKFNWGGAETFDDIKQKGYDSNSQLIRIK
ncbi:MAG: right-handed parallel beta-helix repeat-containing protein [bacterium]|nr:right-handed parallel beta-helix repeat-containing protein [bacterium]